MTERATERPAATQSLDQAILVTAGSLFGAGGGRRAGDPGPLTRVGGVALFLRAVLTLQRAGINELLVLAGEDAEALKDMIRADARVTLRVRWIPAREFPPDDARTWEALGSEIRSMGLIVGGRAVFSQTLIRRLREMAASGEPTVVVRDAAGAGDPAERTAPPGGTDGHAVELLAVPGSLLRAAATAADSSTPPLHALVQRAVLEGRVRSVGVSERGPLWCCDAGEPGAVELVERKLLESPAGELDGFVDRYVNRPLSKPLTSLFLWVGVSPNAVTGVSIGIGLVAAACFAWGSYAGGVLGALLFQLSAVVDCCDGDVARVTFAESEFGAQLDLLGDNVVHMAIFLGIAWGVTLQAEDHPWPWLPLLLGGAAVIGTGLSVLMVRRAQTLLTRSAAGSERRFARARTLVNNLASRDFTVIVLLFALTDLLDWFLWFAAIGSNAFGLLLAWYARPSAPPRA